jgi:hypothetical protein
VDGVVEQLRVPEEMLSSPGDEGQDPPPEGGDHAYADIGGA